MIKPPFPWFGGKSRVADQVWQRFGSVANYVEPFAGSLAVLLNRPDEAFDTSRAVVETVNDLDCYLANFWRALQAEPEVLTSWVDWPVNEADLHARHWWLVKQSDFREQMRSDPDYYDVKIAGWWVWGICQWIGSGWCEIRQKRPHQKRPHLGDAGRGLHRPSQKLPILGNAGVDDLYNYIFTLADRLRKVRVCCGDWSRVCGETPTFHNGLTGVFLDPPYAEEAGRADVYAVDDKQIAHEVREWAIENGANPLMRIALCGYEGEHVLPDDWECVAWKARGGYSSQNSKGNDNPTKERIWFSPHCLKVIVALNKRLF